MSSKAFIVQIITALWDQGDEDKNGFRLFINGNGRCLQSGVIHRENCHDTDKMQYA